MSPTTQRLERGVHTSAISLVVVSSCLLLGMEHPAVRQSSGLKDYSRQGRETRVATHTTGCSEVLVSDTPEHIPAEELDTENDVLLIAAAWFSTESVQRSTLLVA